MRDIWNEDQKEGWKELGFMTREQLDQVPFDRVRWECHCKKCTNKSTKLRDYGIHPVYYWPTGKDKGEWLDLNHWQLICGKHGKIIRQLKKKGYSEDRIKYHLIDHTTECIDKVTVLKTSPDDQKIVKRVESHRPRSLPGRDLLP